MAAENKAYESDGKIDEPVEYAELMKEKFKYFVKEFLLHFKNKEKCLRHLAKCKSRFHSFFQKRNNTYEIPSEMINLMASVPLVAPIINVNVNIPTTSFLNRGFFNSQHFVKSKTIVNTLDKYSSPKVEAIMAVVARELIRIYEYQFSLIKYNEIEIIARHAVDCILVYCCSDEATVSRNSFLEAIICGQLPKKKQDKVVLENGKKWSVFGIFKKPGLRRQIKKNSQGKFAFFTKDNSSESNHIRCDPEKYGYRSEVLQVDEGRKQYTLWDYDKKYELQTTTEEEHQKYEPMFLIADTTDLFNYTSQIDKESINKTDPKFSNFMAHYYGFQNKLQVVYRQIGQCCEKIDLQGANLSKIDFTYALFHKTRFANVENVKFYGSLFLFVTFNDICIQNSDFYRANFLFCHFQKVNFNYIENKFLETKMIYSRYNKIEVNKTSQLIAAISRKQQSPENELVLHTRQSFFDETEHTEVKSSLALNSNIGNKRSKQDDTMVLLKTESFDLQNKAEPDHIINPVATEKM